MRNHLSSLFITNGILLFAALALFGVGILDAGSLVRPFRNPKSAEVIVRKPKREPAMTPLKKVITHSTVTMTCPLRNSIDIAEQTETLQFVFEWTDQCQKLSGQSILSVTNSSNRAQATLFSGDKVAQGSHLKIRTDRIPVLKGRNNVIEIQTEKGYHAVTLRTISVPVSQ